MNFYFLEIYFASTYLWTLGILLIILVLSIITYISFAKQQKIYDLLASKSNRTFLFKNYSYIKKKIKFFLYIIAIFCMGIALICPQWGIKEELIQREGHDLLIALDISKSMLSQDIEPNRLEAAKKKIKNLIESLRADRIGLILFAESAIIQCPLTVDTQAFFMALNSIDNQVVSSSTTALDAPIKKSIEIYQNMPAKKHKFLVIFTDGEDFASNLSKIKDEIKKNGLQVFTVGVGTLNGAPVPKIDIEGRYIGYEKNVDNSVAISHLNEKLLKLIASDSGGEYVSFSSSNQDIDLINSKIKKYKKEIFEDKTVDQLQERYYYFAIIALIALLIEWIL